MVPTMALGGVGTLLMLFFPENPRFLITKKKF